MKSKVNLLLNAYNKDTELEKNNSFKNKIYYSIGCNKPKKWIANILPHELLNIDIKETIDLIATLSEDEIFYKNFPNEIKTPNYGDNWGRYANYIEINNRAIADMNENRSCCGILNTIQLLPAIPPSAKSWANCVILSQIFPNIYGDTYNGSTQIENSIYGIKLNCGYSGNIIDNNVTNIISPLEQFECFNNLANFRGIKTGFRTVISADQIKVAYPDYEEGFNWDNKEHFEIYISEHVKLINCGFEAIFIDSAKHIGGYDMEHYTGVGALPSYEQMQNITYEIRKRTGKTHISFIGEKSTDDFKRYENLGLNAGTDYISGDNFNEVKKLSETLKYNKNYAPGVEIENDNYSGGLNYEQILNRINTALFAYTFASDKLPSFIQMNDIFPLRYDTNTHQIMMSNPSYATNNKAFSHIENLFTKEDGRHFNHQVGVLFAHALCI